MVASTRIHNALSSPTILKPVLRAYLFAHASTTGPRLLGFLFSLGKHGSGRQEAFEVLSRILLSSLELNRFPAFCGSLVSGYIILQYPLRSLIDLMSKRCITVLNNGRLQNTIVRFVAAFTASWLSLPLLNMVGDSSSPKDSSNRSQSDELPYTISNNILQPIYQHSPTSNKSRPLVGQTLDLSLLVSVRAIDTVVGQLWSKHTSSRAPKQKWVSLYSAVSRLTDTGIFAVSAAAVMWAWFYLPERLPRAYNKWISEAAQVDHRLLQVLRNARRGEFIYGKDNGQAALLQSMCKDYNWPLIWGDPAQTIPMPCEMVHMGTGPSCHWHALVRFGRAFKFSLAMYIPIQLLVTARHPSIRAFKQGMQDAIRSSIFLGAFISIFYYSVCLSRTLLGPKIFSRKSITPTMMDSGLCVSAGCILCGWSILIEAAKKRQEVAFFVAPRAAATLLPRRYDRKYLWREQLAFSLSTGVLFAFAQENPARVRGILGQIIRRVLD